MSEVEDFLTRLFRDGAVRLRARPNPAARMTAACRDQLSRAHELACLHLAGPPLELKLDVAFAAARLVQFACWALLVHDDAPEELARILRMPMAARTLDDSFSADLVLRYLPMVYTRAMAQNPGDSLVKLLSLVLRSWPLSGVLSPIEQAPLVPPDFANHRGLNLLYAGRYLKRPRPAWAPVGVGSEYLELIRLDIHDQAFQSVHERLRQFDDFQRQFQTTLADGPSLNFYTMIAELATTIELSPLRSDLEDYALVRMCGLITPDEAPGRDAQGVLTTLTRLQPPWSPEVLRDARYAIGDHRLGRSTRQRSSRSTTGLQFPGDGHITTVCRSNIAPLLYMGSDDGDVWELDLRSRCFRHLRYFAGPVLGLSVADDLTFVALRGNRSHEAMLAHGRLQADPSTAVPFEMNCEIAGRPMITNIGKGPVRTVGFSDGRTFSILTVPGFVPRGTLARAAPSSSFGAVWLESKPRGGSIVSRMYTNVRGVWETFDSSARAIAPEPGPEVIPASRGTARRRDSDMEGHDHVPSASEFGATLESDRPYVFAARPAQVIEAAIVCRDGHIETSEILPNNRERLGPSSRRRTANRGYQAACLPVWSPLVGVSPTLIDCYFLNHGTLELADSKAHLCGDVIACVSGSSHREIVVVGMRGRIEILRL